VKFLLDARCEDREEEFCYILSTSRAYAMGCWLTSAGDDCEEAEACIGIAEDAGPSRDARLIEERETGPPDSTAACAWFMCGSR
jgi:hypothetical protein